MTEPRDLALVRNGNVVITGRKTDVTDQIASLIEEHQIEVTPAEPAGNRAPTIATR